MSTTTDVSECGDGAIEGEEECDDSNQSDYDACTNECKQSKCGDGFQQLEEQCDDGNANDNDECTTACEYNQCGDCPHPRPNILVIVDYSVSMNTALEPEVTRYEAIQQALVELFSGNHSFHSQHINFALLRFGHDPSPAEGTTIPNENTGIVDGHKLDVAWYDDQADPPGEYITCAGTQLVNVIQTVPPPMNGSSVGIGTWTKGAFDYASALIEKSRADHAETSNTLPSYVIILITDGAWTNPTGMTQLQPPEENPALVAEGLYTQDNVSTFVLALGEASNKEFADEIAFKGGTGAAYSSTNAQMVQDNLATILGDIDILKDFTQTCQAATL